MKTTLHTEEANNVADLFDQYAAAVYGYLLRLSGDQALADDLTNETFYRAMLALEGFRGEASVKTWLLRIARNLYLNRVMREKRVTSLDALEEQGVRFTATHPGPEAVTLHREQNEALERALLALSETDRSILLLASQEKLSYLEIGQVLGISVAAVKVRVFRTRLVTFLDRVLRRLGMSTTNLKIRLFRARRKVAGRLIREEMQEQVVSA